MVTNNLSSPILSLCLVLLFLLVGCDSSKQAPDPPHAEAALVVELFSALKDQDYQLAEKKIRRLKIIHPNEIFLENIQNRLQNNQQILKAQKLLDADDVDGAIESLSKTIYTKGQDTSLVDALNQVEALKNIKQLIDNVLTAKSSREIAVSSGKLNRVINSYPSAKALSDFSNSKLNYARSLLIIEKALAIEDLKADIDIAWIDGASYLDTMVASLEVEDPDNVEVLAYKKAMHKNWLDRDIITKIYSDPSSEFALFRKGLLLEDDTQKKDVYNTLLYLFPNNFKSLLIKAMLLKYAGYLKESSSIARQIAEALSIPSFQTKQWFRMIPANLIDFNRINPFVLYPFFIYCKKD